MPLQLPIYLHELLKPLDKRSAERRPVVDERVVTPGIPWHFTHERSQERLAQATYPMVSALE